MDGCGRGAEVVGEVLREGFDGGFGGVIGGVGGRVGDALFGAGDDDGGVVGRGAEGGEEGGDAVYDAVEVGVEDLGLVVSFRFAPSRPGRQGGSGWKASQDGSTRVEGKFEVKGTYLVEILHVLPLPLESNPRIQHQKVHASKPLLHFPLQVLPFLQLAHIHSIAFDVGFATFFQRGRSL